MTAAVEAIVARVTAAVNVESLRTGVQGDCGDCGGGSRGQLGVSRLLWRLPIVMPIGFVPVGALLGIALGMLVHLLLGLDNL